MEIKKIPHFRPNCVEYIIPRGLVLLLLGLTLPLLLSSCNSKKQSSVETDAFLLVPTPAKILKRSGNVTFNNNFWVITDVSDTSSAWLGKYLVNEIDKIPGMVATIADLYSTRKHQQGILIEKIEGSDLHPQGYNINLTSRIIKVQAVSDQGLYNGINTVLNLLKRSWDEKIRVATIRKSVIKDQPFYSTRALQLTRKIDSLDLSKLLLRIGQLKINSIYLSPDNAGNIDQSILEDSRIVILSDRNVSLKNQIDISDDRSQWPSLFTGSASNSSDTIVIKLSKFTETDNKAQLLVASQLSWYGQAKNGYDLIEKIVDEGATNNH